MSALNLPRFNVSIKNLRSAIDDYLNKEVNGEKLYKKAEAKAKENVQAEDEFRDDFCKYLEGKGYEVKKEAEVVAEPDSGMNCRLIDLMICAKEADYVPIQLKFDEEDEEEIGEDIGIVDNCIEHYDDITQGYVILLTKVENSKFERRLKMTAFPPYRYAIWFR